MSVNQIIVYIMLLFMVWAAIDKFLLKNRFGYGAKFDEAFDAMGPLALSIVGIMCFAPVLGSMLTPVFTPLYNLVGADPAMLAGSLLASDMGGLSLAAEMTDNIDIQALSGILLGSTMGVTIIFVIPYTSTIVKDSDRPALSKGIMTGIIAVPFGCFIGGLIGGIAPKLLLVNLIPVIILAAVLALLLFLFPNATIKAFSVFSKIVTVLLGFILVIAIIQALGTTSSGNNLTIIPGMAPIEDQFIVVGLIVAMLAGAYPFIHFLTTILTKPLIALGKFMGVNSVTVAGMIASLANSIAMYPMIKDMDKRGKVVAVSFSICAGFCLGDFLAFTSARMPEFIFPMIIGKLSSGVIASIIGMLVVGKGKADRKETEPATIH